jgi:hypothetical protein
MIDLGQAMIRPAKPAPRYTWEQVKLDTHTRGTLCVIRQSSGVPEVLKLSNPLEWREWVGAFSRL